MDTERVLSDERWLPISGYEGLYEISDHGRVRSVERYVPHGRHKGHFTLIKSKILSQVISGNGGYLSLGLLNNSENKRERPAIHQLVANAFLDNPDKLPQINHIDADRKNNHYKNLEWCTASHNLKHSYDIGNRPRGSEHHFSKLPRDSGGRCLSRKAKN